MSTFSFQIARLRNEVHSIKSSKSVTFNRFMWAEFYVGEVLYKVLESCSHMFAEDSCTSP